MLYLKVRRNERTDMRYAIMVIMVLMMLSSNAWCRNSSGGYHLNHYQNKQDYGLKKNEWKRLNSGY